MLDCEKRRESQQEQTCKVYTQQTKHTHACSAQTDTLTHLKTESRRERGRERKRERENKHNIHNEG